MFLPGLAAIGLLWIGFVQDRGALMGIQHVVTCPAMLGAMLLRRDEYSATLTTEGARRLPRARSRGSRAAGG